MQQQSAPCPKNKKGKKREREKKKRNIFCLVHSFICSNLMIFFVVVFSNVIICIFVLKLNFCFVFHSENVFVQT
jgi:hypothetical protein